MDIDRGPSMIFTTVKINPEIKASDFERKPQCFDVPNQTPSP